MNMNFDYYYGRESEQFSFFRIPRLLFQDDRFKKLSCEAKLLYGLMLDRLSLSQRNNWIDEEGRVYIIYKLEHICIEMNCGKDKAVKTLAELDAEKGIGLIDRKRQGQGRATIIYVKNFASFSDGSEKEKVKEEESQNRASALVESDRSPDFGKIEVKTSAPSEQNSTGALIGGKVENFGPEFPARSPDFGKSEFKTSENPNSRLLKNRSQDFGKSDPSYIDINKTEGSETDLTYPSLYHEPVSPAREISEVSKPLPGSTPDLPKAENDTSYRRFLRQNTGYDRHMRENPDDDLYQSFFELLCDVVESKSLAPIYVNKQPFPPEVVRSRLLKITEPHMEYVVNSFRDNPNPDGIHNVRSYMLTMLYNAPVTFKAHICQQVNHDMYGGGWEEKGIAPAEAFSPFQENEGGRAYAG